MRMECPAASIRTPWTPAGLASILHLTSTPTAVPTYLDDPCHDAGVYGTACACLGVPRTTTTTAATPTVTESVTSTTFTTVTITPTPGACIGRTCGAYDISECGLGPFGACACGLDATGASFCFVGSECPPTTCAVNADCPEGSRCLVGSCCLRNICAVEAPEEACTSGLRRLRRRQQQQQQGAAVEVAALTAGNCTSISPCEDGERV
ncbi:hypothetical protein BO99DRAFT_435095 [Aspergillus violaceofuscus CBS 115571]|uniref:Uncharacterized protein n=1 Tax=Aspergillus violaceofuscus (strain CBS 115571) TaxID=1450538 RepID=A0A2V5H793_ASPV1|nr:hypothetical protein BO99DRAFT_435095 [Aspergillus violaceofuscus CBS 115571]